MDCDVKKFEVRSECENEYITAVSRGRCLIYTTCLTPSKSFKKLEVDITVYNEKERPIEDAQIHTSYVHWNPTSNDCNLEPVRNEFGKVVPYKAEPEK